MPTWTGWDEQSVRQSPLRSESYANSLQRQPNASSASGFTPINRTVTFKNPQEASTTSNGSANTGSTSASNHRHDNGRPTVASDYLGRDTVPSSLYGPSAKKSATKGRKRAQQSSNGHKAGSKRQKSDLSSRLPASKSGDSATKAPDMEPNAIAKDQITSSTDVETVSAASKAKLDACRLNHLPQVNNEDSHERNNRETRPVTLYSQPTSIETVQQHQPETTMQALQRKAQGKDMTFTSSSTTIDLVRSHAQHSLSGSSSDVIAKTRVLRPKMAGRVALSHRDAQKLEPEPQLPTPVNSDPPAAVPPAGRAPVKNGKVKHVLRSKSDDEFAVLLDDDNVELIDLTETIESITLPTRSPPPRERKQNMRDVEENEDYGGALFSREERKILMSLKKVEGARKPIVRTAFPQPMLDRSSLFGASNTTVLRTCFRVGEALNTGCQAVRNNDNVVLELFARVTESSRDEKPSRKQHFVVKDLYHDNPPHLRGTFELWDQSALWELDSRPFLTAGIESTLCRLIARMKRDGTKWRLEILNIWQASWRDVEHVAGIYEKA